MKNKVALTLAVCLSFGSSLANAQQMTITAECTTDETGGDGVRHDCNSEPSTGTAPDGFVFNQNQAVVSKTSGTGDEHSCNFGWSDFTEVLPGTGITQPKTFTLSAHARSPSGHWAGRGWAKCTAILGLAEYQ